MVGMQSGLADLYTENGQLMPTGSDFITGKAAIRAFWQGAMDMGIKTVKLEAVETERQGVLQSKLANTCFKGKQVTFWIKASM